MTGLLIALAAAAGGVAGDPQQPADRAAAPASQTLEPTNRSPDPVSLQVTLVAGAWLPRLGGTAALGTSSAPQIDLQSQLNLDDQEAAPNVELSIRRHEIWELTFSGFGFSTDSQGLFAGSASFGALLLNDGDLFSASFKMTSYAAELSVAVYCPYAPGSRRASSIDNRAWDGRAVADLRLCPMFGMRWVDVDQSISSGAVVETGGGEWAAIYGGLAFELECRPRQNIPLVRTLRLDASAALGPALGGGGGAVWQVQAGLTVQLTEWAGVMFGYRLLELDVESDDYTLNGGLQGLFVAGTLRF